MRVSGRAVRSAATTSRPLPSARRKSMTAKSGGSERAILMPSATLSAASTLKPRRSMATRRRSRSGLSSSTRSSDLPAPSPFGSLVSTMLASPCHPLGGGPIPRDAHAGAALAAIPEREAGAVAPQQRLGDEEAEAHMAALVFARRNIRFSEAVEQERGKARTVVGDLDFDLGRTPARIDMDGAAGELGRVLDEGAERVDHLGHALDLGLGAGGLVRRRRLEHDRLALGAIGLGHEIEELRERHEA